MTRRTDVVVVGGGPAGMYTAHQLAEAGYRVSVLDSRREIGEQVICTGIVSREAFERYGFSHASVLSSIQKLRLISPGGLELRYTHPSVLAYAVDRHKFDNEIRHRAQRSGAEVSVESSVQQISVERGRVRLSVQNSHRRYELSAALCVIATGIRYTLHRQVGLGVPSSFLKAAQAHLPAGREDVTTVFVGQRVAPGGFAWVVPLGRQLCRVGLMTHGDARRLFHRLVERLQLSHQNGHTPVDLKPIAQGMARCSSTDRVIAVGEAAGQVKTTTGGGIYYGLLGAEIAAEVAARALARNDLSARALGEYDRLWKRRIGGEIEKGFRTRQQAARLSDAQMDRLVRASQENGLFAFAEKHARFDWHRKMIGYVLKLPAFREALLRAVQA